MLGCALAAAATPSDVAVATQLLPSCSPEARGQLATEAGRKFVKLLHSDS